MLSINCYFVQFGHQNHDPGFEVSEREKENITYLNEVFFYHISHLWKLAFLQPRPLCAITEASPRCNSKAFGFHGIGTKTAAIGANPKVTKVAMIAMAMPMLDIRTRGKEAVTAMMTVMEVVTVARFKICFSLHIESFWTFWHGILQLLGVPDYSQNKGGLACECCECFTASRITVYQDHRFLPPINLSINVVRRGACWILHMPYSSIFHVWLQDMRWQVATTARWRAVVATVEARRVVVNRARPKKSKAWWGEHQGDGWGWEMKMVFWGNELCVCVQWRSQFA